MTFAEIQKKSRLLWGTSASAEYLELGCAINDLKDSSEIPSYFREIKAAFLGSFTLQGLPEVFSGRSIFHNLLARTYLAPYNQVAQEILNKGSALYKFQPDIVYLLVDGKDILDIKEFESWINYLCDGTKFHVVIFNFVSGRAEEFNKYLIERHKDHSRIILFDFAGFINKIGLTENWNTKYAELGDLRIAPAAFPALSEAIVAYAVATAGATRKCLVLDLDNTIWQGIVGEDDPDNLIPNSQLQKHVLALSEKGVILAINSRNNLNDAMEIIEHHPRMILRKDNFAAWRINWQNKDQNIRELAEELNIGLDSFVFVDDDAFQRSFISESFPEIAVLAPESLNEYAGFHLFNVTDEDLRRNQMYIEERVRKEYASSFTGVDDFLRNLNLEIVIEHANDETLPRISQLTKRTNQFNLTTRRYSESDIGEFLKKGWEIWSLRVKDKFGDYGVTGAVIIDPSDKEWRINNFLLSCRVLGRGVERALLARILDEARAHKAHKITADFIPTSKNSISAGFLTDCGFQLIGTDGERQIYSYNLKNQFLKPDFIRLTYV